MEFLISLKKRKEKRKKSNKMDSSYHDEDSHLLPRSEDCSARLEHPDDSRRSSSAVVNRHRRAQHSSVTMRRDSEPSREQTEDSPRGQGHQSLSRSWNGFPGNGCVYARHDHDTVSKSVTSIRHPIDSPDNSNVMPKTPLDKADGDDVGDASRRRLQRRLMTSVVLALLCYIMGMMSLLPLQSQYLFRRFAVDFFNLTNVTMRQVRILGSRDGACVGWGVGVGVVMVVEGVGKGEGRR